MTRFIGSSDLKTVLLFTMQLKVDEITLATKVASNIPADLSISKSVSSIIKIIR